MLAGLLNLLPLLLRLFGLVTQAAALIEKIEARKKAKTVADIPTTKQERIDAANKGEL